MQETEDKVTENEMTESEAPENVQAGGNKIPESEGLKSMQVAGSATLESEVVENPEIEDVVVRDNAGRKKQLFIILGAAIVLLVAVIIGISVFGGSDRKLQEQLDLGAKYLEEMDYEQALVAFNTALAIEPKNVDAYLGIVEVYIRTNEFELALETAKEGYEVTGDERLKEIIDMIESGDIFASNGWQMRMSGYDVAGNLVFWHEYTYNLKGQQASVATYNAQGVQEQYLELAYDEEGRALITYSWSSLDGSLDKRIIKYDGNNYRETWYVGLSDEVGGYSDVEADSDGKALKSISYDKDGSVMAMGVCEYDEAGNQIKGTFYNSDNSLIGYDLWTYDEDGRCLLYQKYDNNNVLTSYTECVYDGKGNCIGSRHYDANGVLQGEDIYQ